MVLQKFLSVFQLNAVKTFVYALYSQLEALLTSNTLPSWDFILDQNHLPHYSATHNRPTQNILIPVLPSPPIKPSGKNFNAYIFSRVSSLLIKSPMAQWLRRPTVTTNSNREIRSSILRGGVSFLRSFASARSSIDWLSQLQWREQQSWSLWCVAGANHHILPLLKCLHPE